MYLMQFIQTPNNPTSREQSLKISAGMASLMQTQRIRIHMG